MNADYLEQISRAYGFPIIDYERPGGGICIASGSGMMMAVMDSLPCLRWGIEIDPPRRLDQWSEWLLWVNRLADLVVVAGTFSEATYQCPERFVAGFQGIASEKLHYYLVGTHLDLGIGKRAGSLEELFLAVKALGKQESLDLPADIVGRVVQTELAANLEIRDTIDALE